MKRRTKSQKKIVDIQCRVFQSAGYVPGEQLVRDILAAITASKEHR